MNELDFRLWHKADIATVLNDVRFRGQSGHGEFMSTRSNTACDRHRLLARRVVEASRAFMIWCHGARGACTNSTLAKPFFLSGGEFEYRVRSASEPHERVVRESELSATP
jgi:hypothetical protein